MTKPEDFSKEENMLTMLPTSMPLQLGSPRSYQMFYVTAPFTSICGDLKSSSAWEQRSKRLVSTSTASKRPGESKASLKSDHEAYLNSELLNWIWGLAICFPMTTLHFTLISIQHQLLISKATYSFQQLANCFSHQSSSTTELVMLNYQQFQNSPLVQQWYLLLISHFWNSFRA